MYLQKCPLQNAPDLIISFIMKIYYCSIAQIKNFHAAKYLSAKRRERMQHYLRHEDRARCLAAGLLLRAVLGAEKYARIAAGPYGKLYLPEDIFFNLSHAGEYVVLATASCEVGVDIEKITPSSAWCAPQCCTPAELAWLTEQGCDYAFFRLWTGKESVMKAAGLGFRLPPDSFQLLPVECGSHFIAGQSWFLQWHSLPGHVICTAAAEKQPVQLLQFSWEELLHRLKTC